MHKSNPKAASSEIAGTLAIEPPGTEAWTEIARLFESGFIDGLVRRLDRRWGQLDRSTIEDAVSDALLALYDAMTGPRKIGSVEAYVFKVAANRAQVRHEEITGYGNYEEEKVADADPETSARPGLVDIRAEALRLARQLLPRLGQSTIQRVMGIVFDAIEADLPDISPAEIAETLGVSSDVVRQALHRGFQRLRRVAEEEGLQLNLEDVLGDETPLLDDQEEDDDDDQ
jgi:DNA-directed RNA polymerase specialized sigma24 family protein